MVSNWEKGAKYRIDNIDSLYALGWLIPCSYFKFYYADKRSIEYKNGFFSLQTDGTDIYVDENNTDETSISEKLLSISATKKPLYLEFIFDYNPNDYTYSTVSPNTLKNITNLVASPTQQRHLFSIWCETTQSWYHVPCPSSYQGLSTTIVDSTRNKQAQVIGQVVASDVAKIEASWNFLTVEQFSELAQLFEAKYGGKFFVPVSFFDEVKGEYEGSVDMPPSFADGDNPIRIFYPNDRTGLVAKIKLNEYNEPIGYENVSLHLIDTGFKYGEI